MEPFRNSPPTALALVLPLQERSPTPARLAMRSVYEFPEAVSAVQAILSGDARAAVDPMEGVVRALDAAVGQHAAPSVAARQLLATAQYHSNSPDKGAQTISELLRAVLGEAPDGEILLPGSRHLASKAAGAPAVHPEDAWTALRSAAVFCLMEGEAEHAVAWADELLAAVYAWGTDADADEAQTPEPGIRWMNAAEAASMAGVGAPEVDPAEGLTPADITNAWKASAHALALEAAAQLIAAGVELPRERGPQGA